MTFSVDKRSSFLRSHLVAPVAPASWTSSLGVNENDWKATIAAVRAWGGWRISIYCAARSSFRFFAPARANMSSPRLLVALLGVIN
jgi:hypothetical protein